MFLLALFCFFLFCVLLLLLCAAFPVVCPAFAAAFGSLTVEKPTLAALDLLKCQEQILHLISSPLTSKKVKNNLL